MEARTKKIKKEEKNMKLYIKKGHTYKQILQTRELARRAGVTKQAIAKNPYLHPVLTLGRYDFYIMEDVIEFIAYQHMRKKFNKRWGGAR